MKKRALAMILIFLMTFLTITGCSSPAAAQPEEKAADKTLRLRLSASLTSLDWGHSVSTKDMKVWHQMYEGLYGMDEANNGYYKELAKDVVLGEDKKVYTITLQDGVKFQNGDALKASDVVFSYKRAMKNPRFNYLTSMITDVEAVDDSTVMITLNAPYSPIDHTFYNIKIMSEKEVIAQGDAFGTIPHKAGTGAYYVTEYDVATGVKMDAFQDYWRGAPAIKAINYIVISDETAAVIAYENGELDYYEDAPLSDWESLSKTAGENSTLIKGNNIMFMGINYLSQNKVLANEKVRQAICYAVSKSDINLAVSNGFGAEATQYMPSEYVATSPVDGYNAYPYNLDLSKKLLAEAGYPNGVDVGTILTYGSATSNNAKMAQALQADLAKAGITAAVSVLEAAVVTPRLYAQDYDLCVYSDSGNYDFNNIRQQVSSESVGMYIVKYKDGPFDWQRIEELINLGASTAEVDQRRAHYSELWSIVMDTATLLPILHRPVAIVWAPSLNIGKPVPTYYKIRTFSWK